MKYRVTVAAVRYHNCHRTKSSRAGDLCRLVTTSVMARDTSLTQSTHLFRQARRRLIFEFQLFQLRRQSGADFFTRQAPALSRRRRWNNSSSSAFFFLGSIRSITTTRGCCSSDSTEQATCRLCRRKRSLMLQKLSPFLQRRRRRRLLRNSDKGCSSCCNWRCQRRCRE